MNDLSRLLQEARTLLTDVERERLAAELTGQVRPRDLKRDRNELIRQYRVTFHAGLGCNAAAEAIDEELGKYESGEWRAHRLLSRPPVADAKRTALFWILKCENPVRYDAIKKIIADKK